MGKVSGGSITPGTGTIDYPNDTDAAAGSSSSSSSSTSSSSSSLKSIRGDNLGNGAGVFAGVNGSKDVLLEFRSLIAGSGITIQTDVNGITITNTGTLTQNINDLNGTLNPNKGGTGLTTIPANRIMIGNAAGPVQTINLPSANGQVLTWNGTTYVWSVPSTNPGTVTSVNATAGSTKVTVTGGPITTNGSLTIDVVESEINANNLKGTMIVAKGGTGATSFATGSLIVGNGTSALGTLALPTANGQVLTWNNSTYTWAAPAVGLTSFNVTGDTVINVQGGAVSTSGATIALTAKTSGVVPQTYTNPTITVDAYGRITSATQGAAVNAIQTGSNAAVGGARVFDDTSSTTTNLAFRRIKGSGSVTVNETATTVDLAVGLVTVGQGGTGATTLNQGELLIGNGTNPVTTLPVASSANQALMWNGTTYTWANPFSTLNVTANTPLTLVQNANTWTFGLDATQLPINTLNGNLSVSKGGTGSNTFTANGLLIGNGTSPVSATIAPTTTGQVLTWNGTTFAWQVPTVGDPTGVTPGNYAHANVQVDQYGRVTNISASIVGVAEGGTGTTALTNGGLLIGNGTSPVSSTTAPGGAGKILVSTVGGFTWEDKTSGVTNYVPDAYTGEEAELFDEAASKMRRFRTSDAFTVAQNANNVTLDLATVPVIKGGTGNTTFTAGAVVFDGDAYKMVSVPLPAEADNVALMYNQAQGYIWGFAGNGTPVTVVDTETDAIYTDISELVISGGTVVYDAETFKAEIQIGIDSLGGVLTSAHGGTGLSAIGTPGQMLRVKLDGTGLEYVSPTTYSLPVATTTVLGGVKQGNGVVIAGDGTLNIGPQPYDIPSYFKGVPANGTIMARTNIVRSVTLPAGLTGSLATSEVAATASTVLVIKQNTTQIGTITFAVGATTGTFTFASQVVLSPGDKLYVYNAATADATLADVSITLVGTR